MKLRAGKLRHRIQLQRVTQTANPRSNQPEDTWATYATVWAGVEPITAAGGEHINAQQVTAETSHLVQLRHVEGVRAADRVLFGSRELYIERVANEEERDITLELYCTEKVA